MTLTALVTIQLPEKQPREDVIAAFEASAPNYADAPGLLRKYYLYDGNRQVGGFYVWQDRASAEAVHTKEWLKKVGDRYGATPEISWFEVPIIVDNSE